MAESAVHGRYVSRLEQVPSRSSTNAGRMGLKPRRPRLPRSGARSHCGHRRIRMPPDSQSWNGRLPTRISPLPGLLRTRRTGGGRCWREFESRSGHHCDVARHKPLVRPVATARVWADWSQFGQCAGRLVSNSEWEPSGAAARWLPSHEPNIKLRLAKLTRPRVDLPAISSKCGRRRRVHGSKLICSPETH